MCEAPYLQRSSYFVIILCERIFSLNGLSRESCARYSPLQRPWIDQSSYKFLFSYCSRNRWNSDSQWLALSWKTSKSGFWDFPSVVRPRSGNWNAWMGRSPWISNEVAWPSWSTQAPSAHYLYSYSMLSLTRASLCLLVWRQITSVAAQPSFPYDFVIRIPCHNSQFHWQVSKSSKSMINGN